MPRRRAWIGVLGAGAVLLAAPALAEIGRRAASDFHRRAVVEGLLKPGGAYAVALSREAVEALKKGGEVRLFDAEGREIPSLVHTAVKHSEVVEREVTIFNRGWQGGASQTLSVELTDRKPQAVNEFVFDVENEQYNARVLVEASHDAETWQILRDGLHLIRHTVKEEKIAYAHDVLRVPTARFRFYRFTLRRAPPFDTEDERLEIQEVKVRQLVGRGSSLSLPVRLERYDDEQDDDARHYYWKLELDREDLGVDRVQLTIPGSDFARSASLWEWSNDRRRRTRRLAGAVLFHYGDDVHTEFSGFATDAQVLALRIDQGDDEPVNITAARASRPRQQVRFLAPTSVAAPLALYFAPDESREPDYDLDRRLREHEVTSFAELALGGLEQNPGYLTPPEPRSERIPYLLYALVIPLVVGLGWYVARTIQRGVPPQPSDPS